MTWTCAVCATPTNEILKPGFDPRFSVARCVICHKITAFKAAPEVGGSVDKTETQGWVDLAPYWKKLEFAASLRDAQKKAYASSRYWNGRSHFIGLCGEMVYGIVTGQEPDLTLRQLGDGGSDFPGVDVKTTVYWQNPCLLVRPEDLRHVATKTYALVALDEGRRRGRLVAEVDRLTVAQAPLKDWGNGPMLSLDEKRMAELGVIRCPA